MDKYLQSGSKKCETRPASCLEALKIAQSSSNLTQNQASSAPSVLSALELACERNRQQAEARNFVGWKSTHDGKKVYTTFRNQHKVSAEGAEGFRLALADSKAKTKRKVKDLVNEQDGVETQAVQVQASVSKRQKNTTTNSVTVDINTQPMINIISNNSLGSFFRK